MHHSFIAMTPSEARKAALLTQQELAQRAGLSLSTITRIEAHGFAGVRPSTQRKIAKALRQARESAARQVADLAPASTPDLQRA